jgi:uncharacterized protein YjiS (DUF1127 family)
MIPFTLTTSAPTVEHSRISRVIANLNSAWHRFMRRRLLKATVYTLQGLDDRTLSDIGLDRSEIESAVLDRGQERLRPRVRLGGVIARG